ncbi:MAG: hypothetical protein ACRC7I_14225, partial [Selenomonadaceae bacterium]
RNVYYFARIDASTCMPALKNRDNAAKIIKVSARRLAGIELGEYAPYGEEIIRMATAYNAPELLNHFCTTHCAIGEQSMSKIELLPWDRLAKKSLAALHRVDFVKSVMMELAAEDGVIKPDDCEVLLKTIHALKSIGKVGAEIDLFIKKNLKGCSE